MKQKIRWTLLIYDSIVYVLSAMLILVIYPSSIDQLTPVLMILHGMFGLLCELVPRMILKVYRQIWRYAGPPEYISLIIADAVGCCIFLLLRTIFPRSLTFVRSVSLFTISILGCIILRLFYQLIYQNRGKKNKLERMALHILKFFTHVSFADEKPADHRIKIAIVGAGSVGTMLANELRRNPNSPYQPVCFVDIDSSKVGRDIGSIPVIAGTGDVAASLKKLSVQEVVLALPNLTSERRVYLYSTYQDMGYKIKAYDYPVFGGDEGEKRSLRDVSIEDLLFRDSNQILSEETMEWYRGKHVMITGGGGSIGSELARQIARCQPSRLVILDVYENGAYEIQQELRFRYGDQLNLRVEIVNICDEEQVDKIFREHTPDIVLHAAAHKHVPLMERNVCEAVKNNIFGTLHVVEACEKYGVQRFIMVSTDKAVNPTNVMGATKRMCEMIVLSRSGSKTSFSATRFGNVLGSNGSVIPLFQKQIANGGPVTITDKRIIRYFMTIPEASQLVLTSGAMARNGDLYVLNMGKPVKILDLAENVIRLSGLQPYTDIEIVETGLRPGEKLYEELLIKSETLEKTADQKIFVEREHPFHGKEIEDKLHLLQVALDSGSNRLVKQVLKQVVPTYRSPEDVNKKAIYAEEMQLAEEGTHRFGRRSATGNSFGGSERKKSKSGQEGTSAYTVIPEK